MNNNGYNCVISAGTPLTVSQLLIACKSVTDWHTLGIHLGLTTSQLDNIHQTYHANGVDRLKTAMFDAWLKSCASSWDNLITALKAMGEHTVASNIEAVYSPTTGVVCQQVVATSLMLLR